VGHVEHEVETGAVVADAFAVLDLAVEGDILGENRGRAEREDEGEEQ
jgi:hypothetical protein